MSLLPFEGKCEFECFHPRELFMDSVAPFRDEAEDELGDPNEAFLFQTASGEGGGRAPWGRVAISLA